MVKCFISVPCEYHNWIFSDTFDDLYYNMKWQ